MSKRAALRRFQKMMGRERCRICGKSFTGMAPHNIIKLNGRVPRTDRKRKLKKGDEIPMGLAHAACYRRALKKLEEHTARREATLAALPRWRRWWLRLRVWWIGLRQ